MRNADNCGCLKFWNVDHLIYAATDKIVFGIIYSAHCKLSDELNIQSFPEISVKKFHEWRRKLWDFDVTTWKSHTDDRAFPNTKYSNKLHDVLESKSYDLMDEIIEFLLKEIKGEYTNG
jgi:hypothetical protein